MPIRKWGHSSPFYIVEDIEEIKKYSQYPNNYLTPEELGKKIGLNPVSIITIRKQLKIIKKCKHCKKDFPIRGTIRESIFCSEKCYKQYRREHSNFREVICEECGKKFTTFHKHQRFCSHKCYGQYRHRVASIFHICKNCGEEFVTYTKDDEKRKFCSRKCYHDWLTENIMKYKCKNCKIEFIGSSRRVFCSDKCRSGWYKKQRVKREKEIKKEKEQAKLHPCKTCGKITNNPVYCSKECSDKYWLGGRKRYKHICKGCGKNFENTNPNGKFCSPECYGLYFAKEQKKQGNWNFTSRTFAHFICLFRIINKEEYLKIHDMLSDELKVKFDRELSDYHKKLYGISYRESQKF